MAHGYDILRPSCQEKDAIFIASNSWERLAWTSVPHTCRWATFLSTLIHVTEQIPEMPPPCSQSRRLLQWLTWHMLRMHNTHHDTWSLYAFVVSLFQFSLLGWPFKFPTWRWEAGDANLRASYLPQEQQYLITRRGLQRLRLLGMSKQGKTGTLHPPYS